MAKSENEILRISVDRNASILECLKKMDHDNSKLLLVCDDRHFIGLLSIGDIQRAIIKGVDLSDHVHNIMRKNVNVAYEWEEEKSIKKRMIELRTEFMPIISNDNRLLDVYFWSDLFPGRKIDTEDKLNVPVVIMAGGKGTRLKPITNIIPKALIPIGEKPIVELIMDEFHELGATEFLMSVNYKHEMIKFYFDELIKDKGYTIEYFKEDMPLGTAGSMHMLKKRINCTFFVSNCDIIVKQDYREVYKYHKDNQNDLTIIAALRHWNIPYGTIESGPDGKLLGLKEKPEITYMINTGMYVLEPHLLDEIPENTFFHLTELIEQIRQKDFKIGVFPVLEGAWLDIGEWKEYNLTITKLGFEPLVL